MSKRAPPPVDPARKVVDLVSDDDEPKEAVQANEDEEDDDDLDVDDEDSIDVLGGGPAAKRARLVPAPAPARSDDPLPNEMWGEIMAHSDILTAQALLRRQFAALHENEHFVNQVFRDFTFGDMASPLTGKPYTIVRLFQFIDNNWQALHRRTWELDPTYSRLRPGTGLRPSPYVWPDGRSAIVAVPPKPPNFWQSVYALTSASMKASCGITRSYARLPQNGMVRYMPPFQTFALGQPGVSANMDALRAARRRTGLLVNVGLHGAPRGLVQRQDRPTVERSWSRLEAVATHSARYPLQRDEFATIVESEFWSLIADADRVVPRGARLTGGRVNAILWRPAPLAVDLAPFRVQAGGPLTATPLYTRDEVQAAVDWFYHDLLGRAAAHEDAELEAARRAYLSILDRLDPILGRPDALIADWHRQMTNEIHASVAGRNTPMGRILIALVNETQPPIDEDQFFAEAERRLAAEGFSALDMGNAVDRLRRVYERLPMRVLPSDLDWLPTTKVRPTDLEAWQQPPPFWPAFEAAIVARFGARFLHLFAAIVPTKERYRVVCHVPAVYAYGGRPLFQAFTTHMVEDHLEHRPALVETLWLQAYDLDALTRYTFDTILGPLGVTGMEDPHTLPDGGTLPGIGGMWFGPGVIRTLIGREAFAPPYMPLFGYDVPFERLAAALARKPGGGDWLHALNDDRDTIMWLMFMRYWANDMPEVLRRLAEVADEGRPPEERRGNNRTPFVLYRDRAPAPSQ